MTGRSRSVLLKKMEMTHDEIHTMFLELYNKLIMTRRRVKMIPSIWMEYRGLYG